MKYHQLPVYLASPNHRITINLVGIGGTGSHILSGLASIDYSLRALNQAGLFVRAYDGDIVSETNIGRQLFSLSDLGQNKAICAITKINRFYGLDWTAIEHDYPGSGHSETKAYDEINNHSNIYITAVDSIKSRRIIQKAVKKYKRGNLRGHHNIPYYWLDTGNKYNTGQIILSTIQTDGNAKDNNPLNDFFQEFGPVREDRSTPSCSTAEALNKQDLFVNRIIANYATNMIWTLLKEGKITYRGLYINLNDMKIQNIPI